METCSQRSVSDGAAGPEIGVDGQTGDADSWSMEQLWEGAEWLCGMVARSAGMRGAFDAIRRLGPIRATVLIRGDAGTGKELAARALHSFSPSISGPFATFNCSNLIEPQADAEIPGNARLESASDREELAGFFLSSTGGTLFLYEIGELPLATQTQLLRSLETHEVRPAGSARYHHVDVRVIASTHCDLPAMVANGQFNADLYYRLNAASVYIPPLARRDDDICPLTAHFIEKYNRLLSKQVRCVTQAAMSALMEHRWRDNVRELALTIEHAVLFDNDNRLDLDDLPIELFATEILAEKAALPSLQNGDASPGMQTPLKELVKETVEKSLRQTAGNRQRAAIMLGISRSTLYRMMARYGIA